MCFFNDKKNVDEYIKMAADFDGKELIEKLGDYLPDGSTILELGSGPGKDLSILKEKYHVSGSDMSKDFLEYIRKAEGDIELLELDAASIDTNKKFDCIYSNKVLQHLEVKDFEKSLKRQSEVLNDDGIALHSVWRGSGREEFNGLLFQYYEIKGLNIILKKHFSILDIGYYSEMDEDDSIFFIMRKK